MKKIIETIIKSKLYLTLAIVSIITVAILVAVIGSKISSKQAQIITSSTLMKAIEAYETTGAEFTYNGIAELYKDNNSDKVKCYIKYNATVRASINTKEVNFEVDKQNKTVKIILPEITLTPVLKENEFSYIPENSKVEIKDIISVCKADVKLEAQKSDELRNVAEKNIKENVRAIIYGMIKAKGFEII